MKRLLKVTCVTPLSLYLLASIYVCLIKQQPDLFPQNIDISLGILGGLLLGCNLACPKSSTSIKNPS